MKTLSRRLVGYIALVPVFAFTLAASMSAYDISRHLEKTVSHYVNVADFVFSQVQLQNELSLSDPSNCNDMRERLRYEQDIDEMLIFNHDVPVCSSLSIDVNSAYLREDGLTLSEKLEVVPVPNDPDGATIAVISHSNIDSGIKVVSFIDRNFIRVKAGYFNNPDIGRAAIFIRDKSAPPNSSLESDNPSATALSSVYDFKVLVEVSDSYIKNTRIFYLLVAFPSIVSILVLHLGVRRLLDKNNWIQFSLKRALNNNEFILHYQPQVDAREGKIHGYEALVRWQHPSNGLLYPDVFIPMIEQQGLMDELTKQVLKRALTDVQDNNFENSIRIAINVSASFLKEQQQILEILEYYRSFQALGISLEIEVTERDLLDESSMVKLKQLRTEGVGIHIDDFGTGQTSLSVLEKCEVDCLKIDKCFIDGIGENTVTAPVLEAIVALGKKLNVQLIAEGVETREQADYLLRLGVVLHQGYFYASPSESFDYAMPK